MLFKLLHLLYWRYRRTFSSAAKIGNFEILFIDAADGRTKDEVVRLGSAAVKHIADARGGFGELVTWHLRFMAAKQVGSSYAMPVVRGFVTPLDGLEGTDSRFLAARLVWAATQVRLYRDSQHAGGKRSREDIRRAAHAAQMRFLDLLPGAEDLRALFDGEPD